MALLLLAGCAGTGDGTGEPTASAEPSASASAPPPVPENGAVHATEWSDDATITRYPILADGTVGEGSVLLTGPATDASFPGVVDGVGDAVLTGTFADYLTADLALRSASTGTVITQADGEQWCGGEGLTFKACVLLDDQRLARTSELGDAGGTDGTITISSLQDGSTMDELGPFPGLIMVLGTSDADTLMLVTAEGEPSDPPENLPGKVLRLDVTSGQTTELGSYGADWAPLCAIGLDSVLGFTFTGTPTAAVVGPAPVGTVQWSEDEDPVGCSADGAYLYVQHFPQPPGEDTQDTEPPNPPTTLDRLTLADGSRQSVLTLDPGIAAGPITR
jgi:hypothetical protein